MPNILYLKYGISVSKHRLVKNWIRKRIQKYKEEFNSAGYDMAANYEWLWGIFEVSLN